MILSVRRGKGLFALLLLLFLISGCGGSKGTASASSATGATSGFPYRGFNVTAYWATDWGKDPTPGSTTDNTANVDSALKFAVDEGSNMVVLVWFVGFNNDGTMVQSGGSMCPPWADIITMISKAKAKGLQVLLKPVVSTPTGANARNMWNTDAALFLPSNFFPAWQQYLLDLTTQIAGTPVFAVSVGHELNFIDWKYRSNWASLISAVRANYAGTLTYSSIYSQSAATKDIKDVVFWDLVDFISVSLYISLSYDDNASVSTLKSLMTNNPTGDHHDPIGYLKGFATQYGKKIYALEGGYKSTNGGYSEADLSTPPDTPSLIVNYDLQSRGLDAYLGALAENKGDWFMGVNLWQIMVTHMNPATLSPAGYLYYTKDWTVNGKPAADIVKKWYTAK